MPKLKGMRSTAAIIERRSLRETSVEEAKCLNEVESTISIYSLVSVADGGFIVWVILFGR